MNPGVMLKTNQHPSRSVAEVVAASSASVMDLESSFVAVGHLAEHVMREHTFLYLAVLAQSGGHLF